MTGYTYTHALNHVAASIPLQLGGSNSILPAKGCWNMKMKNNNKFGEEIWLKKSYSIEIEILIASTMYCLLCLIWMELCGYVTASRTYIESVWDQKTFFPDGLCCNLTYDLEMEKVSKYTVQKKKRKNGNCLFCFHTPFCRGKEAPTEWKTLDLRLEPWIPRLLVWCAKHLGQSSWCQIQLLFRSMWNM